MYLFIYCKLESFFYLHVIYIKMGITGLRGAERRREEQSFWKGFFHKLEVVKQMYVHSFL